MWVEEFLAWAPGSWYRENNKPKTVIGKPLQDLGDMGNLEPVNTAVAGPSSAPPAETAIVIPAEK